MNINSKKFIKWLNKEYNKTHYIFSGYSISQKNIEELFANYERKIGKK